MAFEAQHIDIALEAFRRSNVSTKEIIKKNLDAYCFGAICPDTFYYFKSKQSLAANDMAHGSVADRVAVPTNEVLLEMLNSAGNDAGLAFAMGYATHQATDIVFHPVIYFFSGMKGGHALGPEGKRKSRYFHWVFETQLALLSDGKSCADKMMKVDVVDKVFVDKVFGISKNDIKKALRNQLLWLKAYRSKLAYWTYKSLFQMKLIRGDELGIFYEHQKHESIRIPAHLEYRDLISGEEKSGELEDIVGESIEKSVKYIEAASAYANGELTVSELKTIIPGSNLCTGVSEKTLEDVVFSADLNEMAPTDKKLRKFYDAAEQTFS